MTNGSISMLPCPHTLQLRPVTAHAAADACSIVRQSITHCCVLDHHHDATVLNAWLANKTPDSLAAWISAPDATAWGAYRGDTMVGFALLTGATLALCYVVPDALHQGVGRALLVAAEAHAQQAGLAVLWLESTRTAEAFYRRNGYEPAGALQSWAGLQAQPMRKVL